MASGDEAGEHAETPQHAHQGGGSAFGQRLAAPAGRGARAAAPSAGIASALRRIAGLKPYGLSWSLGLCIVATAFLGLLALLNRPQIDDGAAYYVAAGALIFAMLMLERFGLFTARRPILLSMIALAGAVAVGPLVEGYWYAWSLYWKHSGPWPNPADPTLSDMLAFDHPWCSAWSDGQWFCDAREDSADFATFVAMQPGGIWEEQSNARARCWRRRGGVDRSIGRVECGSHAVPSWCTLWWNGALLVANPAPGSLGLEGADGGTPQLSLTTLPRYPGQCMTTKWD